MQKTYFLSVRKLFLLTGLILFTAQISWSQATYLPYSYQFDQKFDADIYSVNTSFHTSLKPFIIDSVILHKYNALMQVGVDSSRKGWVWRKLFNEHLFDEHTSEYTFFADYLPDLQVGHDFKNKDYSSTDLNTRGYQIGGTIGNKFYFYSSGYEDQGKFDNYVHNYVSKVGMIPGEAYDRDALNSKTADWSYVTAIVSYTPIKQLNITLGEDKTFIGDGYRSLLLSDYAANYPLLRLTATLGPVQYMFMVANLEDKKLHGYDNYGNNRRKTAVFHYVDWNVTKRLSLGFFDALIAAGANDNGSVTHGFDVNYINPLLFSSSIGPSTPYKDNILNGFTGKYKIFDKSAVYAQLLLDRVGASDAPKNTGGYQVGIRGADLFGVKNFNYLLEYNTVKPYTYASTQSISSYSDYSEPLGDPLGANFKETIVILDYSIGRFDFQGQLNYAAYGVDSTKTADYGKDFTKPIISANIPGASTGQGISTHLYYAEGTVGFLINPKYNLRLELGGLYRMEKNSLATTRTELITFGLRSTFRDLYHDF
jgi:hypothetical protein